MSRKRFGYLMWTCVQVLSALFVLQVFPVAAEPQGKKGVEMTPGPRMIRAVEALANDYLAARDVLKLSPEQEDRIRQEVASFKKDLWKKEAVLIGMFNEISLKRRHGLLSREEYRNANQVTGGIEADELGRMLQAIGALQAILTPAQKEAFAFYRRPQMSLEMPEGFNTRLGLRAITRWGAVYGEHRQALGLSEAQTVSFRSALEEARREILRIGNDIEISRMEAYDLLKEPIIDTEKTREAMERTAHLEGIFFPKLSEVSRKLEGILTPPQRTKLAEIRKERPRLAGESTTGSFTAAGEESLSFLDQAEKLALSRSQIEKLVALETAAIRHLRLDEAQLKIERLELEDRLRHGSSDEEISEQIDRITQRVADIEKDRLANRVAGLKVLDEKQRVAIRVSSAE
ncbi:MAG: hypothetical protein MPW16_21640 (plasmid) [Candidatus Manganitrophus sp.]|nr:MAG: hypothetical protein MPW16_21640 [Candidatus Manganitrophus sp.]